VAASEILPRDTTAIVQEALAMCNDSRVSKLNPITVAAVSCFWVCVMEGGSVSEALSNALRTEGGSLEYARILTPSDSTLPSALLQVRAALCGTSEPNELDEKMAEALAAENEKVRKRLDATPSAPTRVKTATAVTWLLSHVLAKCAVEVARCVNTVLAPDSIEKAHPIGTAVANVVHMLQMHDCSDGRFRMGELARLLETQRPAPSHTTLPRTSVSTLVPTTEPAAARAPSVAPAPSVSTSRSTTAAASATSVAPAAASATSVAPAAGRAPSVAPAASVSTSRSNAETAPSRTHTEAAPSVARAAATPSSLATRRNEVASSEPTASTTRSVTASRVIHTSSSTAATQLQRRSVNAEEMPNQETLKTTLRFSADVLNEDARRRMTRSRPMQDIIELARITLDSAKRWQDLLPDEVSNEEEEIAAQRVADVIFNLSSFLRSHA